MKTPTQLYNNYRMCSTHFEDSQFTDPAHTSLVPYAIPTILESVPNPPPRTASKRQRKERHTPELHSTSLETSETTSLSDEPLPGPSSECSTPKKRKVPKEVARLRTKVCRLKNLPDNTISFIETQIQMSKQSKHAKRWSISDKMLVLSIFYHSRKAYCLPSKSTLLRSLRKSNLSPGFSDKVFDALKLKVASMPQIACQCAVTVDEISLKSALAYNSCDVMSLKVLTTLATWGRAST